MPAPNKSGLETKIQSCVDAATLSTSTENLLSLAVAKSQLCSSFCNSFATSNDLPDIFAAKIPNGQLAFVADIEEMVMASNCCWIGLDGRSLRNDMPTVTLWTWGANVSGSLADGTTINRSSPVTVVGSNTTWNRLGLSNMACSNSAIKQDGTLWTWGYNLRGQLGTADVNNRSSPVTTAAGGTTWIQSSTGTRHSHGVKSDGTLWSWGYMRYGRLGNGFGTTSCITSPEQACCNNWVQVSAGCHHGMGIQSDGTLWGWGLNPYGVLGTGNTTSRNSPGAVAGGGTNWSYVNTAYRHSAGIKTDGTLWTWGRNPYGQLGNGTSGYGTCRSSPVTTAGGGTNWCNVSVGRGTTAGIKTDGTLWTWGYNFHGQLGIGTSGAASCRSSPGTTAGGGTTWLKISLGCVHVTALKTDGTLWTWGCNTFGQLGDGGAINRSGPVTVSGGGTNWCSVSGSANSTIALTAQG